MKKILKSLSSVPALLTAGTAALLAVALHSWPIAVLGAATCAALAAADAAKGSKSKMPSVSDPQTATALRAILTARARLDEAITVNDAVAAMLAPVSDLEARAAKLARRAEDIASHLKGVDFGALKREIDQLAARIPATADPTTRAACVATLEARQGHLETLMELVSTKERIAATLLSIAATLDALPAKVVRLRGIDDATNDVGRELAHLNEEIGSFEETLMHIHGVS